jgi:transposase
MNKVTTIGLDLAKNVFQIHGVDASGEAVIRRRLRRRQVIPFFEKLPPCLIGVEACATSHHWARELHALGHTARIMPANYVKPYVKRNKNDAADAEAICEAVTRPTMRFVAVKSAEQQSLMMLHRTRSLLIRQRTMLVNAMRAHLAEFGIVAPVGLRGVKALLVVVSDPQDERLPSLARICLESLVVSLMTVEREAASNEPWSAKPPPMSAVSTLGIVRTRRAAASKAFPASGQSSPPHLLRRCQTLRSSNPVASSPPGSVWSPNRPRPGARNAWGGYPNREINTSDGCWSPAPCR